MSALAWAWVALVGLGAGWVRGFAGFGFSVLCMAGLAWQVSPALIVPVVITLEIAASLQLWRGAREAADARWLKSLLLWNLLGVPVGVALLYFTPIEPLRGVVAALLFAAAISMRFVIHSHLSDTSLLRGGCGMAAGLLNGVAASGGIVVGLTMTAAGIPASKLRSTMIVYLLFTDAYVILFMLLANAANMDGANAFFNEQTPALLLALGLPMGVGVWLGRRHFNKSGAKDYRSFILNLLIVMSSLGLARFALA